MVVDDGLMFQARRYKQDPESRFRLVCRTSTKVERVESVCLFDEKMIYRSITPFRFEDDGEIIEAPRPMSCRWIVSAWDESEVVRTSESDMAQRREPEVRLQ